MKNTAKCVDTLYRKSYCVFFNKQREEKFMSKKKSSYSLALSKQKIVAFNRLIVDVFLTQEDTW